MARKTLAESAEENPTALGDPVSLKAETSDSSPTENDRPNQQGQKQQDSKKPSSSVQDIAPSPTEGDIDVDSNGNGKGSNSKPSLKDTAQRDLKETEKGNKSMLGDPVSLKAEKSEKDPIRDDGMGGVTGNKQRDSKL